MKTDHYTKTVLTVIAACLAINTLKNIDILSKAYAAPTTGATTTPPPALPANYAIVPLNEDGSMNVNLKTTAPMDVTITGIRTNDDLDVNVNLAKIGGHSTYGELPVKVKQ